MHVIKNYFDICAWKIKSRVVCPVIVLTNIHTNENERAWN